MAKKDKIRLVEEAKKKFPMFKRLRVSVKPDVKIPDNGTPLQQLVKTLSQDSYYMLFIDGKNVKIFFPRFDEVDPLKYKLNECVWIDLYNLFERV